MPDPGGFLVHLEPRGDRFDVRIAGPAGSHVVRGVPWHGAAELVLRWLGEAGHGGDVVEVRCGSRLVGSSTDLRVVAALVARAVAA